jgi:L-threonylcarbamoyladenylate synthase
VPVLAGTQSVLLHGLGGYGSVAASTRSVGEVLRGLDMTSPKAKLLPAELLRINAQCPEPDVLRYAADFLTRGSVIAIPTDTFYGLAADPFNLAAVDEIYRVKGRPETRALPILVNSMEQAALLARDVSRNFLRLAEAFWPGGLTLVVVASRRVPLKVTANTGKVALRWPKSGVVEQLIGEFEGPVTGTSANISGFPSCASAEQVMKQLGGRLTLVLDAGATGAALPSTIVEMQDEEWKIVREGAIAVAEIERVLA